MPTLSLHLLGGFSVHHNGEQIAAFKTNKARALLAYLAVEAAQPHSRSFLAGLLWPDWPETQARTYLRQALSDVRAVLGESRAATSHIHVARQSLQFNLRGDYYLDVSILEQAAAVTLQRKVAQVDTAAVTSLVDAAELYCGDLLADFYLEDCPEFEAWQLLTRERLRLSVIDVLQWLIDWHEFHGALEQAIAYAKRSVALEPLMEAGHRRLMQLLAHSGERGLALAHYEQFCDLLADELETAPARETVALIEQIRTAPGPTPLDEASAPTAASVSPLPPFLSNDPVLFRPTRFVDRECELGALDTHLSAALAGDGHMMFVVGDAGRGKSTLIQNFARHAANNYSDLLCVGGRCSTHRGAGDELLPFREILGQLTGDFEEQWRQGVQTRSEALRLWSALPQNLDAVLTHGCDLLGTLLHCPSFCSRISSLQNSDYWLSQIEAVLESQRSLRYRTKAVATNFEQLTKVLQAIAQVHPLLCWIDDLQWADMESIALLFHLGQRLPGYPILVVGAYRPEEVWLASNGQRHPLARVVREMQNRYGAVTIDLEQSAGRAFVDAYLDAEPNQLNDEFRTALCRLSNGHPLFTVELVGAWRGNGDFRQNKAGVWTATPTLDWDVLPPRVEAAIGQRIDRLPTQLHRVLSVASIQGQRFAAEVVARVLHFDLETIVQHLSAELEHRYRLIAPVNVPQSAKSPLTWYAFRQALVQKYVYAQLDHVERTQLQFKVEAALNALHAESTARPLALAGMSSCAPISTK